MKLQPKSRRKTNILQDLVTTRHLTEKTDNDNEAKVFSKPFNTTE